MGYRWAWGYSTYHSEWIWLGTIHLRRLKIFHDFRPLTPYGRQFFTTIRRQIWQIFDPSPPKQCRRLKWMVPNMNYQFVLETGNGKPRFLKTRKFTLILDCWSSTSFIDQESIFNWEKMFKTLGLTVEPCRKVQTDNQQLLRNEKKLKLKYEVNLRFETQTWKWRTRKWEAKFQVYFNRPINTMKAYINY